MTQKKDASKRRGKYQLNTIEDLKREADKSATWRGHKLVWSVMGKKRATSSCSICGADILVVLQPADKEHIISGPAQLHTCPYKPDLP